MDMYRCRSLSCYHSLVHKQEMRESGNGKFYWKLLVWLLEDNKLKILQSIVIFWLKNEVKDIITCSLFHTSATAVQGVSIFSLPEVTASWLTTIAVININNINFALLEYISKILIVFYDKWNLLIKIFFIFVI